MAAKQKYSFTALMNMKEPEFIALCEKNGHMAELNEIAGRMTEQDVYPRVRVWNEEKKKYVRVADKSSKPTKAIRPITFFEVKAAYAREVLKIEKAAPKAKTTFRDRIAAKANNA